MRDLPIDRELFFQLFDYLDERLEKRGCNHDFTLTEEFFKDKDIKVRKLIKYSKELKIEKKVREYLEVLI